MQKKCIQLSLYSLQVLKERERSKLEAEVEAERIARLKEMEVAMERLRKVSPLACLPWTHAWGLYFIKKSVCSRRHTSECICCTS